MADADVCTTLLAIQYAPDNSRAVLTYPSGEKVACSYDAAGRSATLTDNAGVHTYSYDLRGRLTNVTFAASGNNAISYTISYAYDNLDQRTNMLVAPAPVNGVAIPAHTIAYEYDYAIMKLTAITDTAMTPGHKTVQYTYDAKGRLQTAAYANGTTTGHGYDKRGNRLRRTSHVQGQTSLGYDAFSFSGAMSQPVTHYYHPNHRGDTAYLTDASGVTAASYVYDAFGGLLTATNSALTAYRFSSKEWDPDAQLYYFGYRWYDPDTGTWTTKDPISFASADPNVYAFVKNRPAVRCDSYGLYTNEDIERELKNAEVGQTVAMYMAIYGVPLIQALSRFCAAVYGTAASGGDTELADMFERDILETAIGLLTHITAQLANALDELFLDTPGNFNNYWGMSEVYRHERYKNYLNRHRK